MVRYLLTVAGAVALMSNFAFAETGDLGASTTKVITRAAPDGMGSKKVIIKRHENRYGALVTKKKVVRDGMSGSSVTRTREKTDPATGMTTKSRTTEMR